ncbi:hypothetical protein COCSUDRAFT_48860 [Coccomyxa subellipsoidea C-169]|uniref:ARM repeat-containing protein n=1 Tax=Coccomyxa subellipsoidea (strain C-169) TaxID=574566 RepID=I0YN03_COCSC|nr:hypothetical protein COCSUDRAFT_48860 [Coccomyxa subellipsoidea C-169]EIE19772.1 hypothetical protein COCSUDRAFT_48860 [Coccomyxa subellipsoidea C-169]|eukprot:XP_005644316.1 hypothetical protein COCSUDRAFT_48860 [Coccomyxa subellipsoidea C-169]
MSQDTNWTFDLVMFGGSLVTLGQQGWGGGRRCREILLDVDVNRAEALSVCGKDGSIDALHDAVDVLKNEELRCLISMIEADSELSTNPAVCRRSQTAAALLLQRMLRESPSMSQLLLQEKFLEGLVLMVDEGRPAMQAAAAHLLAELAASPDACKAICQAQGGLVVAMLLKTSRSAAARAAAAGCLMKLLPQLSALERQILWSIYPQQLPPGGS